MSIQPGHLRPRSLAEILDGAVRHYRVRLVAYVLPFIPMAIASFLHSFVTELPGANPLLPMALILVYLAAFLPGFGATAFLAGDDLAGRVLAPGEAWRRALARFAPLVGLSFLFGLAVGGAAVVSVLLGAVFAALAGPLATLALPLLLIPVFYVSVLFSLSGYSLLLEGANAAASMGRSRELMRNNMWRGVGVMLFIVVINVGIGMAAGGLQAVAIVLRGEEGELTAGYYAVLAVGTFLQSVGNLLLSPLYTLIYAHFYWDLRVRKEGLDLQMQLQHLKAAVP